MRSDAAEWLLIIGMQLDSCMSKDESRVCVTGLETTDCRSRGEGGDKVDPYPCITAPRKYGGNCRSEEPSEAVNFLLDERFAQPV